MKKAKPVVLPPVDPIQVTQALATAIASGDIVNFRLLFAPFSPTREASSERFSMDKYRYLLPSSEMLATPAFRDALEMVKKPEIQAHIKKELEANRPPQLPADLVIRLADNAVRLGKYSAAAQAYEILRIRRRMQEEFFAQADNALDSGNIPRAVSGYWIAAGLEYDYSAFPEPLPSVADYQTQALTLHAEYPEDVSQGVAMQDPETQVRTALTYLLRSPQTAARLESRPLAVRVAFLAEMIHRGDPEWNQFAQRYREACAMVEQFGQRIDRARAARAARAQVSLAEEIDETFGDDPRRITAHLLGRTIPDGAWWQYLKDLAYIHPAAVLFIARQWVGDHEFLIPRLRAGAPLAEALGLAVAPKTA